MVQQQRLQQHVFLSASYIPSQMFHVSQIVFIIAMI